MRKLVCMLLATLILMASAISTGAATEKTDVSPIDKAKALYDLGLIKGTSETFSAESLELYRNATRTEICVSIVRLLGKENKAKYQSNAHPFYDVPSWAGDYIGWLYENYLVNGYSDTYFGSGDVANINQFCTMLLRVLGYNDTKGDFSYGGAAEKAYEIGICTTQPDGNASLMREEMVVMMYNALKTPIKNSSRKLVTKLCDEKVLNTMTVEALGLMTNNALADYFSNVENTLGSISVKYSAGKHTIGLLKEAEHYGIRVFVQEKDTNIVTEIRSEGDVYFKKGKIKYYNYDPAGYISSITVYGLNSDKHYSFIVIKTSSEGELYSISGKSDIADY